MTLDELEAMCDADLRYIKQDDAIILQIKPVLLKKLVNVARLAKISVIISRLENISDRKMIMGNIHLELDEALKELEREGWPNIPNAKN